MYYFNHSIPAGNGTELNPYQIATLDDLLWLSNTESAWVSGTNFIQTSDIDASDTANWNNGAGFNPIGIDNITPFKGIYNGSNYFISNLYINRPAENNIGLFGYCSDSYTEIKNVELRNLDITGNEFVGGLIGYSIYDVYISNVETSGSVIGFNRVGGIVGRMFENVSLLDSNSNTSVTGNDGVGGLAGDAIQNSLINNCHSSGNVTGNDDVIGGLIGSISYSTEVTNCYAETNVVGVDLYIGGLIGYVRDCQVTKCFSNSDVDGGFNHNGGLIGYLRESDLTNCYSRGNVEGIHTVGGLIGYNSSDSSVENCYSTCMVTGSFYLGGFIGINSSIVNNCVWNNETSNQVNGMSEESSGTINNLLSCTTLEMQDQTTYTNIGWDFIDETINGTDDIWDIDANLNDG